ncbi:hypothetical protein ACWQV9_14095 [Brevundimonas diminuta]
MGVSLARTAVAWRLASEADEDVIERLEKIILRHSPKSAEEAATMLDVVAVNVSAGQRCDGLDVAAIESVSSWLRDRC